MKIGCFAGTLLNLVTFITARRSYTGMLIIHGTCMNALLMQEERKKVQDARSKAMGGRW